MKRVVAFGSIVLSWLAACASSPPATPQPSPKIAASATTHAAPCTTASVPATSAPNAGKAAKTGGEAFLSSFLVEGDLPGLRPMHEPSASLGTEAFRAAGGELAGTMDWVDPHGNEVVWRVYDSRWTFNSEADARRFLRDEATRALTRNGGDVIADAPPVGQDCIVIGRKGEVYGYMFRLGHVVAAVVAMRGPRAGDATLRVTTVAQIAEKATLRLALLAP